MHLIHSAFCLCLQIPSFPLKYLPSRGTMTFSTKTLWSLFAGVEKASSGVKISQMRTLKGALGRLNTLNKCASMKLDVSLPKKKSEDSDEEDLLAISNRWTFEWNSRRWSRLQDIDYLLGRAEERSPSEVGEGLRTTVSSESILTDLSEPEICSLHSEDSLAAMPDSASLTPLHLPRELPHYGSLPAKSRRRGRTRAKDFLRRMETLGRTWGPSMGRSERRSLVISGPVLQSEPEALKTLRCIQIFNGGPLNAENMPPAINCPNSLASSEASTQSETSGSAESTPNMKGRVSKLYPPGKRAGVYLEDIDVLAGAPQRRRPVEQSRKNEFRSYDELLVHIPKDHKPGTFPKALSIESLTLASKEHGNWKVLDSEPQLFKCRKVGVREIRPVTRCCPRGSRISVYDNVPGSHLYASTGDLLDLEKEDIFPHLDDILQHVNGLQQIVDHWSKNVLPESEGEVDGGRGQDQRIIDGQSSSQITLDFEGTTVIEGLTTPSDGNKDGVSLNDTDTSSTRERRDSGPQVAQLQDVKPPQPIRNLATDIQPISGSVPKFMKRMKGPDYKDKMVFGVPLIVHVQRYGHPLPISLQLALRFLRSQCLDQVGLFRKSGVKSRIQALRQMCETSPENVNYEDQSSAYDVADMAVQAAIMLMADENREVLQTLLCFLNDVTSSVEENQMTPMNLAVCLAPSLFHLNIMKNDNLSPRSIQRKYATGRPDQKDLNENLAATQGLAHMIAECNHLFEIPQEMVSQSRNSYMEAELLAPSLDELCKKQPQQDEEDEEEEDSMCRSYLESLIQNLIKETKDKTKGWVTRSNVDNTEISFKKVGDGTPLRRWRVSVEVEAPPSVVLNRILRERHMWDSNLLQWKVLETLDKQTEVYQYELNSMAPHPNRDFVVLRRVQHHNLIVCIIYCSIHVPWVANIKMN
ncbi:StAR-related lipid transfer protein 13 [Labeo rohita]|uniref:StAR-related lipid transfer protein 13 n=1 Tax=Labeo rohita TaxID=84645 RepID=A0ABQ8MAP6_LABRO|nr:StAR-related lipid transfer protein 13 [Labeo rohita]